MVREILEQMTPVGRRMMAISIVSFSIYALSSVAMAFVVAEGTSAPRALNAHASRPAIRTTRDAKTPTSP